MALRCRYRSRGIAAEHRVVAYAGPGDEADELRRLSVLGRSCPEPYPACRGGSASTSAAEARALDAV
ncbi:hypothetical protein ACIGW1_16390 [Streptomyces sp. NPDC053780]|uniref:hypothetical protein n=1 Tax=unclassified Streptomyces TaxID=2593676 RepID=UPI003425FA28